MVVPRSSKYALDSIDCFYTLTLITGSSNQTTNSLSLSSSFSNVFTTNSFRNVGIASRDKSIFRFSLAWSSLGSWFGTSPSLKPRFRNNERNSLQQTPRRKNFGLVFLNLFLLGGFLKNWYHVRQNFCVSHASTFLKHSSFLYTSKLSACSLRVSYATVSPLVIQV